MSRVSLPMVGNEFVVSQPRIQPVKNIPVRVPDYSVLDELSLDFDAPASSRRSTNKIIELFHEYSMGVFAVLFLLVASSAVQVGAAYWSASIAIINPTATAQRVKTPQWGPNSVVKTVNLDKTLALISAQPISLTLGSTSTNIKPEKIQSMLKITEDKARGVSYIKINQDAVTKAVNEAAAPYISAPLNQITATDASGTSRVIATGKNGTKLGDTSAASKQISETLMSAKGMQINIPVESLAFSAGTISDFDKLIEVNIVTKQMYLYEKGVLVHSYPISAGAVATPTPVGQYKIYQKLPVQDMRGFNANGTRYFQPKVKWVNYFLSGGYGIHGNYWRPKSWFGAVNSSHGCVSLPDSQAKEVYDWAPIGTTVITHT